MYADVHTYSHACTCRDDLERAVRNMKGLGRGLEIITLGGPHGGKRMIQSVPCELSNDREHCNICPKLHAPACARTAHFSAA